MRLILSGLMALTCVPTVALAAHPHPEALQEQLAYQMNADHVEVTSLEFERVRSRVLFPAKARMYSIWNGERPVRTPNFYDVKFHVTKGGNHYAFRCTLRSYGNAYVGIGQIDTSPGHVILADECRFKTDAASAPPAEAGLILSRPLGRENVLLHARPLR